MGDDAGADYECDPMDVSPMPARRTPGPGGRTPGLRSLSDRVPPVAESPASPATTGSVWRALEELTAKHNAAVSREEALRTALTQAQKAAGGHGVVSTAALEEKERALAAALARAQTAEAAL